MTVKIVDGDLLQATENIIAHQVNAKGVMGSGVAAQIRSYYPKAYWEYKKKCEKEDASSNLLGHCQIVRLGENRLIANLFGQDSYGRGKQHTDVVALKRAFESLRDYLEDTNLSLALPYGIGCGLGGGNWSDVYLTIEEVFSDFDVTLYRYNG